MNYPPNTIHWPVGSLVIHDMDAKKPEMLMRVTGYTKDGLCVTRYDQPNEMNQDSIRIKMRRKPMSLKNDIKYLHDPKRFNL